MRYLFFVILYQMHREKWDIKVEIRDSLKKGLVFNLQARLPIGILIGYYGYRHEAAKVMQLFSH